MEIGLARPPKNSLAREREDRLCLYRRSLMAIGGFCFARVALDTVWRVLRSPSRHRAGVFRECFAATRLACEMPRRAAIVSGAVALNAP